MPFVSHDQTALLACLTAQHPERDGVPATPAPGIFVAVAGPSGAGKDSLISCARAALSGDRRFVFVRRVVTRSSDTSEDHDSLSEPAFRFRADTGDFALWWEANGLLYGLPATVRDDLSQGRIVVANISRDVIARVRESFPRALIIHITATVDVLSKRLASRGRENEPERSERLSRSLLREQTVEADIRIENNGALAEAGARFIATLTALASPAAR